MNNRRILLISPPQGLANGRAVRPKFQTHPLGLLYLASVLESNKYCVEIFDAWSFGIGLEEIKEKVVEYKPHLVGLTAMTILARDAYLTAQAIKDIDRKIITVMGGPHTSAMPEEAVKTGNIDFAVVGEGEYILLDICNHAFVLKGDFEEIKGLVFKKNGKIINTCPSSKIEELDELPFPAYHLLPSMSDYNPPPHWGKRGKFASIITSRGCPYDCSFCSVTRSWGKKYRYRNPEKVVDELEVLNKKYGMTFISFRDSVATLHKKRLIEICKEIINRKLKITWNCNAAPHEVNEELLKWMKKAGCKTIMYGLESGNEEILSQIKFNTREVIKRAIDLTHKIGITPHGYFVFGLPGETNETMRETIDFAKSLKLHQAGFTSAVPFPGTNLWDYSTGNDLIISFDWDRYNLKGTPPSKHLNLTSEEILKAQKTAFREFYLRPKAIYYQLRNIRSFNDLKSYMYEALINLRG